MRNQFSLIALLTACGGAETTLTSTEAAALGSGTQQTVNTEQLLRVTDAVYGFDGRQDLAQTEARARGLGCATVSRDGTTLSLAFADGCTVSGVPVSGSLSVGITKDDDTVSVAVQMDQLNVDGKVYTGELNLVPGASLTVSGTLSQDQGTVTLDLAVTLSADYWLIDGDVTISEAATSLTLIDVRYQPGDCYPSGGVVQVQQGAVNATLTFDAATAQSGQAVVTIGRVSQPTTLPAYGECPAA